ncbi:murein hydrolase activator EnvC family protein [Mesorhizobium xinjiangense]|uniref:murein hydrolase activator EnvC family protein n=1 Tax=Mesorhizobium xinjiangense TaxID=2678685 RepID=UPI0012EE7F1E|nr:murein hydrolase activator EnvC [Mesorhizobium xinjiangense]
MTILAGFTHAGSNRRRLRAVLVGLCLTAAPALALAQMGPELEIRRAESASEYDRVTERMELSDRRLAELTQEIQAVRKDNASITAALIQAAKTEKKLAQEIEDIEERLARLKEREDAVTISLRARRGVLAEVLGALQRMGLNPPPAILVRPQDALSSVRTAILLGAVVPELRSETRALAEDLQELASLRASIDDERKRLFATVEEQAAEKHRLSLLLEEKQKLLAQSEAEAEAERARAAELAAKANSLKDLITSLEGDIEQAHLAAEEARRVEEERRRREAEAANRPVPEGNRLTLGLPFDSLTGKVSLPVSGRVVRHFGEPDGLGGHMMGNTVQTQSGAIVTAPSDGSVLYAGPFRSYGQLLILDAGGGYHIVLAGMGKINVSPGQSVLAGEPVGSMGEARLASAAAFEGTSSKPELYVEFRRNGKPVDPAPWWADRNSGRTRNDS